MNIRDVIKDATAQLKKASIPSARLDALILLEDITGYERGWLLAHPEFTMQEPSLQKYSKLIQRRATHEPLAYIRGKSEFYGRTFLVTADTLQPRPETETMISILSKLIDKKDTMLQFVDIGTGSGCIAITAKLEFPEADVYATEINQAALKIARTNALNLKANVTFYKGNLLEPLINTDQRKEISLIMLANLPYVPDSHTINDSAMQEPRIAIFGGQDGLDLYRELFRQITETNLQPVYILTESLPFQHEALLKVATQHDYKLTTEEDFIQVFSR
jgi:release factor glutamine methyltransferase